MFVSHQDFRRQKATELFQRGAKSCCETTKKVLFRAFLPDVSLSNECDTDEWFLKRGPRRPAGVSL